MIKITFSVVLMMLAATAQAQPSTPSSTTTTMTMPSTPTHINTGTPGAASDMMGTPGTPSVMTPPSRMPGAMSDNQIAGVLMTIDDSEMASSKMALRRAKSTEVKEFARKMITEHKNNMKDTRRMLKTYNSGTARSELGATLRNEAKESNRVLSESSQTGFDKMYVDQQVTMHEKALSTLNENLIPSVTDTILKTHLEKTKTTITNQLNAAKALQTKIQ